MNVVWKTIWKYLILLQTLICSSESHLETDVVFDHFAAFTSSVTELNYSSKRAISLCGDALQAVSSNQLEKQSDHFNFGPSQINFCLELLSASENLTNCNFNATTCNVSCPLLGYHQDSSGCVESCDCRRSGLLEGDIMIDEHDIVAMHHIYSNASIRAGDILFPKWDVYLENDSFIIPFQFEKSNFTDDDWAAKLIRRAMALMENETCIRFVERTDQEDFLKFIKGWGCWSHIGRNGGMQLISFGNGCTSQRMVLHELMHALGFWHEHTRPDRDNYVRVVHKNIEPGREENFLIRYQVESYGSPYDYESVMHYGGYAFSSNNKPTLLDKRDKKPFVIQGKTLSEEDVAQINKKYDCALLKDSAATDKSIL